MSLLRISLAVSFGGSSWQISLGKPGLRGQLMSPPLPRMSQAAHIEAGVSLYDNSG
jgi:hypothetical protein